MVDNRVDPNETCYTNIIGEAKVQLQQSKGPCFRGLQRYEITLEKVES